MTERLSELVVGNAVCRASDRLTVKFESVLLKSGGAFLVESSFSMGTIIIIQKDGFLTANLDDLSECRVLVNFFPINVHRFEVKKSDSVRLISVTREVPEVALSLVHEERDDTEEEATAS